MGPRLGSISEIERRQRAAEKKAEEDRLAAEERSRLILLFTRLIHETSLEKLEERIEKEEMSAQERRKLSKLFTHIEDAFTGDTKPGKTKRQRRDEIVSLVDEIVTGFKQDNNVEVSFHEITVKWEGENDMESEYLESGSAPILTVALYKDAWSQLDTEQQDQLLRTLATLTRAKAYVKIDGWASIP
ncbi:MAG TPA: hypothetical protein VGE45_10365 [Chloroflexia bacterium]|jgi:hypothetical protein